MQGGFGKGMRAEQDQKPSWIDRASVSEAHRPCILRHRAALLTSQHRRREVRSPGVSWLSYPIFRLLHMSADRDFGARP
jgi:hypothetical protein